MKYWKKILGVLMIVTPFAAVFILGGISIGFKEISLLMSGIGLTVLLIWRGLNLLD
jgi:hypothetical protein